MEGTKARLRVLETRYQSSTQPSSGTTASNSYLLNSQHDYETNRSTASTMLMMSRRGGVDVSDLEDTAHDDDDVEVVEEEVQENGERTDEHMPPPNHSQISTPSMKAMVHLPMDDDVHCTHHHQHQHQRQQQQHLHQNNSHHNHNLHPHYHYTKAHQHNASNENSGAEGGSHLNGNRNEATSGTDQQSDQYEKSSEREQNLMTLRNQVQALKRFSGTTPKPSKIPLPGKATTYFIGGAGIGGNSQPKVNSCGVECRDLQGERESWE